MSQIERTKILQILPLPQGKRVLLELDDEAGKPVWTDMEQEGWSFPCLALCRAYYWDGTIRDYVAAYGIDPMGCGDTEEFFRLAPKVRKR